MRQIKTTDIIKAVRDLFIYANHNLPSDVTSCIFSAKQTESNPLGKTIIERLCENIGCASEMGIPICQDTGMAVVFVEFGREIILDGNLEDAINEGVRQAYKEGKLRLSVVCDPLFERKNTNDNTPAIIHTKIVDGDKIKIVAAPKGFGSENMSKIKMFTPSATEKDIIKFVVDTVKEAGGNPCPPIIVGVGIGGNFEYAAYLSKKALLRPLDTSNPNPKYRALEDKLLEKINKTGIGPQGLGGDTTALKVNVEYFPTHIAGLPVAVNINCHVARHAEVVL